MSHFGVGVPDRTMKSDKIKRLYLWDKEGSMQEYGCKTVELECPNCHHKVWVDRDKDGRAKWICPRCRATIVSQVMSRIHDRTDTFAPVGQVLIN